MKQVIQRQVLYDITYVESKKYNKLVNITKKKQTHRYREQTSFITGERGVGRGDVRDKGVRGTNYYV